MLMTNKEKQQLDYEKHPFLETCLEMTTTVLLATIAVAIIVGCSYLSTKYHVSLTIDNVMRTIFRIIGIIIITVITIMATIGMFWWTYKKFRRWNNRED